MLPSGIHLRILRLARCPGLLLPVFLMLAIAATGCLEDGRDGRDGSDGADGLVGPPGDPGEPGPAGPLYWQGQYSPVLDYALGDAVSYGGSSYVATTTTTGHAPTESAYWDILALHGESGTWTGGDVTGHANFLGGANFAPGTSVSCTGANVAGLSWEGGTVPGRSTFQQALVCQDTLYAAQRVIFDDPSSMIRWLDAPNGNRRAYMDAERLRLISPTGPNDYSVDIAGGESGTIDVFGPATNAQARILATNGGDARIQLSSDAVGSAVNIRADQSNGGCGWIELKNSSGQVTVTIDGCTGQITARNAQGQVTIALDPETGDIRYTGNLIRESSQ